MSSGAPTGIQIGQDGLTLDVIRACATFQWMRKMDPSFPDMSMRLKHADRENTFLFSTICRSVPEINGALFPETQSEIKVNGVSIDLGKSCVQSNVDPSGGAFSLTIQCGDHAVSVDNLLDLCHGKAPEPTQPTTTTVVVTGQERIPWLLVAAAGLLVVGGLFALLVFLRKVLQRPK